MKKLLKLFLILFLASVMSACTNSLAARKLTSLGSDFLDEGDFAQAISRLESSLELDSDVFETRFLLSKAYFDTKNCEKALENIIVANHLKEAQPAVYSLMGKSYECNANLIFNKYLKDDENPNLLRKDAYNLRVFEQYIYNLQKSAESFKNYYTISPHAYDALDLNNKANEIQNKIQKIKSDYSKDI